MSNSLRTGVIFAALFVNSGYGQIEWIKVLKKESWLEPVNRIELAKTTESQVSRILGKPEYLGKEFLGRELIKYYSIPTGRVTVSFTSSNCVTKDRKPIAKGIVEEIVLSPKKKIRFSSLKLPLAEFDEVKEDDTPIRIFTNPAHGIRIAVQNNYVHSVTFKLPNDAELQC